MESLIKRLTHLEMLEKARTLVAVYAEAIDEKNSTLLESLFSEDAVLSTPAGEYTGQEKIIDFFETRMHLSKKRHFITNIRPRITSSNKVTVDSYFLFTSQEDSSSGLGWGAYTDLIGITEDGAHFIKKAITPSVSTSLSEGWEA